jgi:pimeloyl-ACP methyl ester carboxylesterase
MNQTIEGKSKELVLTASYENQGTTALPRSRPSGSGEQRADDLRVVVETAELRRPALVGWSLGGFITYLEKYGREPFSGRT